VVSGSRIPLVAARWSPPSPPIANRPPLTTLHLPHLHPFVHHAFSYDLGQFQFTGFGIAVLLAFVIAQITSGEILQERGQNPSVTSDCVFAAVVGGLLGAKIYYAVLTGDISNLFHRAGFVFWGGLMGGIVATAGLMWVRQLAIYADQRRRSPRPGGSVRDRPHGVLGGRRRLRSRMAFAFRGRVSRGRATIDG